MTDIGTLSAAARLRQFEDAILPNAPRPYNDEIERGVGSKFSALPERDRQHHAALERLVRLEAERTALSQEMFALYKQVEAAQADVSATAQHVTRTITTAEELA